MRIRLPSARVNQGFLVARIAIAILMSILAPVMWHAAAVVIGVVVLSLLHVEATHRVLAVGIVSTIAHSLVAIGAGIPLWYLSSAALVVSVGGVVGWYRHWQSEKDDVDRIHGEMVDRARMFSWEVDVATGEIVSLLGNIEAVLGFTPEELVGRHVSRLGDSADHHRDVVDSAFDGREHHAVVTANHRNGNRVYLREVRLRSRADGTVRGVSIDMTELALAGEALRYQAEHDALTGLANRTLVEAGIADALADPAIPDVALIVADLDRFKEINDTLGHPTGDRVLRILAERLQVGLPDARVVARLGGDEFAVVAALDAAAALDLAERLQDLATAPVAVDGLQLAVACSVGVAISPDHGSDFAELLKLADIATYQAKRAGGGIRLYESTPDEMSVTRLQLISKVPAALGHHQFELFLQPQVDVMTGDIVAFEGLARWQHPELGLLDPPSFLHALEVASGYQRFTREMLRQAANFAAAAAAGGRPLPVGVNLSSVSFLDKRMPSFVASLLTDRGLPGTALTIEVTESDFLDEDGADVPVFAALKALGTRLSLDDFGTGYSTLTRLRSLDVDEVKIDQMFVAGLSRHTEDAIIVDTVVRLAKLLGHDVVAEGVETFEQLATLQAIGCPTAQGFLFAEPMPYDAALELLERGTTFDVKAGRRQIA